MKKIASVALCFVLLSGCPLMGNTLVIVNRSGAPLDFISVTRLPDPCKALQGKAGINILDGDLLPDEQIVLRGLVDGFYQLTGGSGAVTQAIEGGRTFEWFID